MKYAKVVLPEPSECVQYDDGYNLHGLDTWGRQSDNLGKIVERAVPLFLGLDWESVWHGLGWEVENIPNDVQEQFEFLCQHACNCVYRNADNFYKTAMIMTLRVCEMLRNEGNVKLACKQINERVEYSVGSGEVPSWSVFEYALCGEVDLMTQGGLWEIKTGKVGKGKKQIFNTWGAGLQAGYWGQYDVRRIGVLSAKDNVKLVWNIEELPIPERVRILEGLGWHKAAELYR